MKQKILFFTLYGSKSGILGQKKRCLGVFWTECEVADLKQRQKTTAMATKTRSNRWYYPQMTLETPQTALINMAPVPVNMAVCAVHHRPLKSMGFL